jgi:hypothetical protein
MQNSEETNLKVQMIFDKLDETWTSITRLSNKTGISRATLHHWKKGGYINDQLRLSIAYTAAMKLKASK